MADSVFIRNWAVKKYGLLTKREVKMAGDISQVLFLREQNPISSHLTEQAWSVKDLLSRIKHHNMINVPCGTQPVSRAGKIAPSCPLG